MKELLIGNGAVARGLFEAGCKVVSSYPGTPSTEITEQAAKYDEIYTEWAPNEKVACEVAIGASFAGQRAFCAMKHVGLNVAADPLYTASYIGVNGGLVVGVADDPGMFSSQNEQDTRRHAIAAKVPVVEPSDSEECRDFVKYAYELSEKFDTPVILRLTTRVAHSRSLVELCDRVVPEQKPYKKNIQKNVMMPAMAKGRHVFVEKRMNELAQYGESCPFNRVEMADTDIGVITSGISYQYVKEALGEKVSVLKLGLTNPLPDNLILDFAKKVKKLYVVEELDPVIEERCKMLGLEVTGKDIFSLCGEYSQSIVKEAILGQKTESISLETDIPVRPPVLCPGCPHRGLYYALKKLNVYVSGDIGCYTLGALAPLSQVDTCVCMGASVSSLHGFNKANDDKTAKKSVAVIGDSTFIHSGVTGLINIAYNKGISTVIILDNSITGMTGHQQNPTTGKTIKGDPTVAVNLEALAKAVGIESVRVIDPNDLENSKKVIAEELEKDEPSLVISRRPCALLKYVKHFPPLKVNEDKCKGCKACMAIGCPSISIKNRKAHIDETLCVGCDVCSQLCKFDAIEKQGGTN